MSICDATSDVSRRVNDDDDDDDEDDEEDDDDEILLVVDIVKVTCTLYFY